MPTRTNLHPGQPRPLIVTADPDLLDDLLRLAAAGGAEPDVAADPAAARPRYAGAPIVLIGADQAQACLRARLPRRPRIVVVGRSERPSSTAPPWDPPFGTTASSGSASPSEAALHEIAALLGAEHVAELPDAEPWLVDRFADRHGGAEPGRVLAVIGGRGGAGASILAGGLAVTAVRAGLRTLLVDADPLGGGLDLVLGWEQVDGLRWPALARTHGRVDPPALIRALPHRGDLVLLSFSRDDLLAVPGEAMAAALDAARRGRDLAVVDLPRQLDDAAVLALQCADRALLVVPAELRATAAAARVASTVTPHCADLSVIVRGPAPGRLKSRDVARALGLPLAGSLRPEPRLCQSLERGEAPAADGRGPLAELCERLVRDTCGGDRVEAAAA